MYLRINKKNSSAASALPAIILMAYVAVNSGSMFQMLFASELQRIECVVLVGMGIYYTLKHKSKFSIRVGPESLFLVFCGIISIFDILFWHEFDYIILYLANFSSFMICYVLSRKINYEKWCKIFINTIYVLAIVSLIGWIFSAQLLSSPYGLEFEGSWKFRSFIIFNIITNIPQRNCGIFWEPGMYQGFLNFAIMIIFLKSKYTKGDVIKVIILATTVITTFSTTGYIVLFLLIVLLIYRILYKVSKRSAGIFIVCSAILFVISDGFSTIYIWAIESLPEIITAKIVTQNVSYNTRVYSQIFDVLLSLKYPFGVGRTYVSTLVEQLMDVYNITINARTSSISTMFVYFGIFGGIAYLLLWIRGIWRFQRRRVVPFTLVTVIVFFLLNSEPMLFHLFFGTILFYWNQLELPKNVMGEYSDANKTPNSTACIQ